MSATDFKSSVFLEVRDGERRRRWRFRLEMAGHLCSDSLEATSVEIDLVLADQPLGVSAGLVRGRLQGGRERGLVTVGEVPCESPPDAALDADATDREVELACRLVSEIVRLRRLQRSELQSRQALAQLALTDPLTQVGNRRAWRMALDRRWLAAGPTGESICLAIFDLDRFKSLNDSVGHAAGDDALRIVGDVLQSAVRREDFAARLGGDEFGLLLVGLEAEVAAKVVERVRQRICERLSATTGGLLSASAGYATTQGPKLTPCDQLLAQADHALHAAKQAGRARTADAVTVASGSTPQDPSLGPPTSPASR
jgi:diguanylate cyclase (GGDEF)-like protein